MQTNTPTPFLDALVGPLAHASDVLVASAYVSPDACERLHLRKVGATCAFRLIVGRALEDGLPQPSIDYLATLDRALQGSGGGVRLGQPAFHSKLYVFNGRDGERSAWIGSSNFTLNGLERWREANMMPRSREDVDLVASEALGLWESGIPFSAADIPIVERTPRPRGAGQPRSRADVSHAIETEPGADLGLPGVLITLLDPRTGDPPPRSGLNWSQGGGRVRHPDEAYVPLRSMHLEVAVEVFGDNARGTRFFAITHDGREMEMDLEGSGPNGAAKQIASHGDKRILGNWVLRDCLRLPANVPVTRARLEAYGRDTLGFYRIGTDERTGRAIVLLDFRPPAPDG